jgi:putative ABC transport system ATP-binding protein
VPILDIQQLTIEYTTGEETLRPIDGLNLEAEAGSLIVLLGPSGCGKTSVLSCLGGILTPKQGSVRFGDIDVCALRGRDLVDYRRTKVGIVFQAFHLVPRTTVHENVMVPLRAARIPHREASARAGALLQTVGLSERAQCRPRELSGGQQQRVAVARALALDPPLLLADEPTAYLDYVHVEEILKLIRTLASDGRVVVVATHDQRLLPLADRVVELVPYARSSAPPDVVELNSGEVLFRQGSWGELIYVVQQGQIEIVSELEDRTEQRRAVRGPGEYFGEIGPLFAIPRSATARARCATVVAGYTTRDFREQIAAEHVSLTQVSPPRAERKYSGVRGY